MKNFGITGDGMPDLRQVSEYDLNLSHLLINSDGVSNVETPDNKLELDDLRKEIDKVDQTLLMLLASRMELVRKVGILKKKHAIHPLDMSRWQEVLNSKKILAESLGLDSELVIKIWENIHQHALRIEEL